MSGNKIGSTGKDISHVKKLNKTTRSSKKKLKQVNLLTPEKEAEIRSVLSKFEHRFEGNTGIEYKWQDIEEFTKKLDINYFIEKSFAKNSIIILVKITDYIKTNIKIIKKMDKINGTKADVNNHYLLNFKGLRDVLRNIINTEKLEPRIYSILKLIYEIKLLKIYNLLNTNLVNKYPYH